jgi:hypothetical protein
LGGRGRWISEFEASLVYKESSRTARATQRNPVLKKPKKKKKKEVEMWFAINILTPLAHFLVGPREEGLLFKYEV